jgi:hypothetical protein
MCTTTPSTCLEYLISHGGKQERVCGKGWKQERGLMAGKRERVHGKGWIQHGITGLARRMRSPLVPSEKTGMAQELFCLTQ